jgi:hypothetical protein
VLPWMVMQSARQTTPLQAKLDDLTRPHRGDFEGSDGAEEASAETAAS